MRGPTTSCSILMLPRKVARQPPVLVVEVEEKGLAEPEGVQVLVGVQVAVISSKDKEEVEEATGTTELAAVDVGSNLAVVVVEVDEASNTRPGPPSNGTTGITSSGVSSSRNSPREPGKA